MAALVAGGAGDAVGLVAAAVDWSGQALRVGRAMNEVMWNQPATQRNVAQLRADGCRIIEPAEGWQACRTEGIGRLAEPVVIIEAVREILAGRSAATGRSDLQQFDTAISGRGVVGMASSIARVGRRGPSVLVLGAENRALASALGLPTLNVEARTLIKRLTLIATDGTIEKVFYPVFPPHKNSDDVIAWLQASSR